MAFIPFICDELFPGSNLREIIQDISTRHGGRSSRRNRHPCPWAFQNRAETNTDIKTNKDIFEVTLDVQQFSPEELTVKTLDNNFIVVEGKHEEREDEHGYVSRHFVRKYKLPDEFDSTKVQSSLSSDGLLTVTSTKKVSESNEKEIPITLTGAAKPISVAKENHQEKTEESNE